MSTATSKHYTTQHLLAVTSYLTEIIEL